MLERQVRCHNVWSQSLRSCLSTAEYPSRSACRTRQPSQSRWATSQSRVARIAKSNVKPATGGVTQRQRAPLRKTAPAAAPAAATNPKSSVVQQQRQPAPQATEYTSKSKQYDPNLELNRYVEKLLGDEDEVIIYKAPAHGSLLINSILGGTAFSGYAFGNAAAIAPSSLTVWIKYPVLGGCVVCLAMGINMLMTSLRQIQSVRLLRGEDRQPMLRFETKWRMLFWQERQIDVPVERVIRDRAINDFELRQIYNVDFADRYGWTEFENKNHNSRKTTIPFFHAWGQGITNLWSVMKRDTGRIFNRQGIMYLRINDRLWKLDTWHAQMLDRGIPLDDLIKVDYKAKNSVWAIIRQQFSG